ncbi:SDR family NAD(P)-dependent oxidoreductase [Sphingorhabdus arenilitoris]|uniref:SDR family NAD(P)-dependent oxidoreductase n=1 Tax=Sphingorhabdus arenilitoris TaxID=1490041 RepID=A0ABV8REK0_9SPHN
MTKSSILVTGCAGFIGYHICHRLLSDGRAVVGIDNLNDYYDPQLKLDRLTQLEKLGGDFTFLKCDFADHEALETALAPHKFDHIIHLGAQAGVRYSLENPRAYIQANLVGHLNILELARHRGTEHMVYASSSSVYGQNAKIPFSVTDRVDQPVSLYAATKKSDELISESYAHLYRIPLTGLRFFTVYGPWGRPEMAPWLFTEAILNNKPIKVFNHGKMRRDFTYIDDIVGGLLAVLGNHPRDDGVIKPGGSQSPHAIYNIGNNQAEELGRFIEIIEQSCGKIAEKVMMDMQAGDVPATYADIEDISRDMGYQPRTSIDTGIPAFVNWYRSYKGL